MKMTINRLKFLISSDVYRISGRADYVSFFREFFLGDSFKYIFWLRVTQFSYEAAAFRFWLFPFGRFMLRRLRMKLGISIPWTTAIGSGFYIGHFGGIVVNGRAKIGDNCNISHGVTIGKGNRGRNAGYPIIGDCVYLGPGAKIIGAVKIGNYAAVGANCVVTKDVPEHGVVVGVPGRIVSFAGSVGYVNRIDYPKPR